MDVLYIGDNEQTTNHFFAGTESVQVYQRNTRDYQPLQTALDDTADIDVDHLTGAEAIDAFPETIEELSTYDVLIFSDLSRDTLLPHFLPDAIPGPNRVKLASQFVEQGGGLLFCGGWMSYQGYQGHGNWHDSHLAETFPVEVLPLPDDRVEAPEGVETEITEPDHPVLEGIEPGDLPQVYGYNKVGEVRERATLLATVDGNALLAAGEHGDGRVLAYTSDPAPKWGLDLLEWDEYERFWQQGVQWAAGSS
jgi:uncharacterized membrane protein